MIEQPADQLYLSMFVSVVSTIGQLIHGVALIEPGGQQLSTRIVSSISQRPDNYDRLIKPVLLIQLSRHTGTGIRVTALSALTQLVRSFCSNIQSARSSLA
jgi:hypothetical protein